MRSRLIASATATFPSWTAADLFADGYGRPSMVVDLKHLFGTLDKPLLRELLEARGAQLDVDWQTLPKSRYGRHIFEAWGKLPAQIQEAIEPILLDINRLAHERAIRGLVASAAAVGVDLVPEFEQFNSSASKILHVMLKHESLWDSINRFVELDLLVTKRVWTTYADLPTTPIEDTDSKLQRLKGEVADFYQHTEGRARVSDISHRTRPGGVEYFFIDLSSYTETGPAVVGSKIEVQRHQPVFTVVFVFDSTTGTLSMVAEGGMQITKQLLAIFCDTMLGCDPPKINPAKPLYQLDSMLDCAKELPIVQGDGVSQVIVQGLRMWVAGQGKRRIALEGDPANGPRDVYKMAEQFLRQEVFSPHALRIAGVKFKFIFDPSGPIKKRSVTFEVSHSRTDSFKEEPESVQTVIRKCLRRWGLDHSESPASADEAA